MADGVKIDLRQFLAFSKKIGDIKTIQRIYNNAFENMLDSLAALSQKNHSFENDTGLLQASVTSQIFSEVKGVAGSVFVPSELVPYAKFVYEGTDPHVIEVKNAQVLTNGENFFGKKVLHPGYKGDPFILNNWLKYADKLTREFLDDFIKQYRIALKGLA